MGTFSKAFKAKMASSEKQQEIAHKIFYNSKLKDKEGNDVLVPRPGGKYYLYSRNSDKKIGWIKLAENPHEASYGWCNLPAFMKMEEPPEIPTEFLGELWDEVDISEYGLPEAYNDYGVDEDFYAGLDSVEDKYIKAPFTTREGDYVLHHIKMESLKNRVHEKANLGFSEITDILRDVAGAHLEYQDAVQDVGVYFYNDNGHCVIDVQTDQGNYADSYDEYWVTDANNNLVPLKWEDIIDADVVNNKSFRNGYQQSQENYERARAALEDLLSDDLRSTGETDTFEWGE